MGRSNLSNRNGTKWSKTNLFAYLCSFKFPKGVTMTGSSNVYNTTQYGKTEMKNVMKNTYAAFLGCEIL